MNVSKQQNPTSILSKNVINKSKKKNLATKMKRLLFTKKLSKALRFRVTGRNALIVTNKNVLSLEHFK
jgi:hypothetical protein